MKATLDELEADLDAFSDSEYLAGRLDELTEDADSSLRYFAMEAAANLRGMYRSLGRATALVDQTLPFANIGREFPLRSLMGPCAALDDRKLDYVGDIRDMSVEQLLDITAFDREALAKLLLAVLPLVTMRRKERGGD